MEQVDNRIASGPLGKVRRGSAVCAFLVLLLTFWKQPRPKTHLADRHHLRRLFFPSLRLALWRY